jgi:hypothetical protein
VVINQDGTDVALSLGNVHKANLVPDFSAYVAEKPGKGGRKAGTGGKAAPGTGTKSKKA